MAFFLKLRDRDKTYCIEPTKLTSGPGLAYWLENEEGEATVVTEEQLFNLLDKFFQENF